MLIKIYEIDKKSLFNADTFNLIHCSLTHTNVLVPGKKPLNIHIKIAKTTHNSFVYHDEIG